MYRMPSPLSSARLVHCCSHARTCLAAVSLVAVCLIGPAGFVGCGSNGESRNTVSTKRSLPDSRSGSRRIFFPGEAQPIPLMSGAINQRGRILDGYECKRHAFWLPLRWGNLPRETKNVALFFGRVAPADGRRSAPLATVSASLVTGLSPRTHRIAVGKLPKQVLVAAYRPMAACPLHRTGQQFFFRLYALPRSVDPNSLNIESPTTMFREALAIGELRTRYGPSQQNSDVPRQGSRQ